MSNKVKDGGPAFPWSPDGPNYRKHSGMTMRDWFAGQALAGLISRHNYSFGADDKHLVAADVYALSDAMLKAREAKQ